MNIELLLKVKAAILEDPDKFDMDTWIGHHGKCGDYGLHRRLGIGVGCRSSHLSIRSHQTTISSQKNPSI